jgi:hypothetical protein
VNRALTPPAIESASTHVLDSRLWSTTERVVFFPVRHHSPTCTRLIIQLIRALRPAVVLVEGPADFNPRIGELMLDHQPPLAIYSYFTTTDEERFGAFYPFFDFSPEWAALRTAREVGATFEFIDLPWSDVAPLDRTANRYADGHLGRSSYTAELCHRLGVDDWNTLWDTLFEIDPDLGLPAFLERCHSFCFHARVAEGGASAADHARESYMLERIRTIASDASGPVLIVTGGFHSSALFAGLHGTDIEPASFTPTEAAAPVPDIVERGLALTPYSYERLDTLTGYDAGLPHPGFYHRVWLDRRGTGRATASHRALLRQAASAMRERGQTVSTADLIGVESFAQGLATLRGHAAVWRTDLVDALLGTLVKEELANGGRHPFLDALGIVFRGSARGCLAPGTPLPPLVSDITRTLAEHDLTPPSQERKIEIHLDDARDRERSQTLHQVRILGLPGFKRVAGTDFVGRRDLAKLWETWTLRWSPEFDAACIERALYGASLLDAVGGCLSEQAARIERDADAAARLLLDASLAGWSAGFILLRDRIVTLVRADASFPSIARALDHLFYLYRYDEFVVGAVRAEIASLLTECYSRATWLLEAQAPAANNETLQGLRALLHTVLTAGPVLEWDRTELLAVLHRIGSAHETPPLLRGAVAGALWTLGAGDLAQVLARLPATPEALGDFLQGVFALAREESQRHTELLLDIDRLLLAFDDEQFLVALPALRLAFTYFTPREKDHLARTLLKAAGQTDMTPLPMLAVGSEDAARALAFESRLFRQLDRHGLRGGGTTEQS